MLLQVEPLGLPAIRLILVEGAKKANPKRDLGAVPLPHRSEDERNEK
jgi:hypothetical protein